ncbi:MAG: prenyltransferase/squalene oxidase repeat-containing protein [Phycisphaeraceae bacterium]
MIRYLAAAVVVLSIAVPSAVLAKQGTVPPSKPDATGSAKWAPAVEPKPLSDGVKKGLAWLVEHQHPSGGWGQGEESSRMGRRLDNLRDLPNVADTCVATLALIRAGSTPSQGPHATHINKALEFICAEVQASDDQSLFITGVRGTRVQQKLGTYIDTFLGAMVLAEVKDQMPDEPSRKRIVAALDKVMDKIETNQREDGTWANEGWAPVLAQAMASKAINRAAQSGVEVDEQVRQRAESFARGNFDTDNKTFRVTGDAAGVELYAGAAALGGMQDSANTNAEARQEIEQALAVATTEPARAQLTARLRRFDDNERDLEQAKQAIVDRLDDEQFIAGFGSNGGEEFLSYMNIGEALVVEGAQEWRKWDESITENLDRVQNNDGSWTGHHCITGRTFCTSTALLVLTVDRAPVPLAARIGNR